MGLVDSSGTESLSGKREEEEEEEKRRRKFGVIKGIFRFSFYLLYLYYSSVEGFIRGEYRMNRKEKDNGNSLFSLPLRGPNPKWPKALLNS